MYLKNKFQDLIVIFSILMVIDFWSYLPFLQGAFGSLDFILHTFTLLVYLFVIVTGPKLHDETSIDKLVRWTIITIMLAFIPAYIDYGQSITSSIRTSLRLAHGLMMYFALRKWDYNPRRLMSIVTIISVTWVIIELGQQITYPEFWFSGRYGGDFYGEHLDNRMGLWRFYIWGVDFVMIAFSYWMAKYFSKKSDIYSSTKSRNIIMLVAFLLTAGLLCYGSRKHMLVTLAAIIFVLFKSGKGNLKQVAIITGVLGFLIFSFFDSYIEMNAEAVDNQGAGEDFIRLISAKYFLLDFSDSILYPIFGSGLPADHSRLQNLVENLAYDYRFYQADSGIIGYYSELGLLGVSAIVMYIYLFIKNWSHLPIWMYVFFLMKLFLIVFDFWAMWDVGMFAYAVFLYFVQKQLTSNKL